MIAAMEREFLIVLYQGERDMLYGLLDRLQSRAFRYSRSSRIGNAISDPEETMAD